MVGFGVVVKVAIGLGVRYIDSRLLSDIDISKPWVTEIRAQFLYLENIGI